MSEDPLKIPVQADGVDQTATALGRVTAALRGIGQQSAQTALSLANDGAAAFAAFERWGAKIGEVVGQVAALSAEQQALDATSARLGLDFNAAADAAGRFVDETEAMAAASQLAEAGIRLTQGEMDQLTARAAILSQRLGIDTTQAFDMLTTAITSGSQRALRGLGPDMVALGGNAHTARERLDELVHSTERMPRATDDAVTSIARFRDTIEDAERTAAHAASTTFVQLLTAQRNLGIGSHEAGDAAAEMNRNIRAAGEAAGETALVVLRAAQMIAGGVATAFAAPAALMQTFFHAMQLARSGDFAGATDALTSFGDHGFLADAIAFTNEGREGLTSLLSGDTFAASRSLSDGSAPAAAERPGGGTDRTTGGGASRRTPRRETLDQLMGRASGSALTLGAGGDRRLDDDTEGNATGKASAQRQADEAAYAIERQGLERRLTAQRSFTEQWAALHERQADAATMAATSISGAFDSLGKALGDHFAAVVAGRESVGKALQGVLGDTLTSVGKEAAVKGGMETAEGLAALAGVVTAGLAPGHFAAAGAYFGVAALAGAAGAAITPSAGGGGAAAGGAPSRERVSGTSPTSSGPSAPTVVQNYYAPTFGGREGPRYEVGTQMNRYTRAADARLQRSP